MGGASETARLLLWAGSVRPFALSDRIRAAHLGKFSAISLFPWDVRRELDAGRSPRQIRELVLEAGLSIPVLDPVASWLKSSEPQASATDFELEFAADTVEEVFAMAEALGAELICASEFWGAPVDIPSAAADFADLCDAAAERGLRIALEPMPFSGISDLESAWTIVDAAARRNGGLVIDSWHFFRCGADLSLLEAVPGEKIFAVQLNDAPLVPEADLKTESMEARLLPGEGELDLPAFVQALGARWADAWVGPEIFNDDLWSLPLDELAVRLRASTDAVIGSAVEAGQGQLA